MDEARANGSAPIGEFRWGVLGSSRHGWILVAGPAGGRDALVLDEFGGLWWARIDGRTAHVVRGCATDEANAHLRRGADPNQALLVESL